ncbi:MAG: nucleotidyl transferase [Alphaproteobacteria bacterium]|nr:nucleotidyl transferase [Alphaproteobacteria bacterium]
MIDPARVDVLVLAGGLGTRLRGVVDDRPKLLAPIGHRPFLDYLLAWLEAQGFRRIVLSLGHLAQRVVDYLATRAPGRLAVETVIESAPLGTAGALRFARSALVSDPVMVMNGDTFLAADLRLFLDRHEGAGAAASLLCTQVGDGARYGAVAIDPQGRVTGFAEKNPSRQGPAVVNAGIYAFGREGLAWLDRLTGPSLERDVLAKMPTGTLQGVVAAGEFVDIGTPESLVAAPAILDRHIRPRDPSA